jgi:hypothetical protein
MRYIVLILFLFFNTLMHAQSGVTRTRAFQAGEVIEFDVYYNWGLIWVDAGWVTFSVEKKEFNNKPVLHFVGEGSSKKNWDWFYKVRDKYQSYNDSANLKPIKYLRDSHDGSDWVYNDVTFDFKKNKAIAYFRSKEFPKERTDTVKINFSTFDPMSMIYYARSLNYETMKVGEEMPITIFLDNKVYYRKIVYAGKETITTDYGTFKCIKFKPSLIPGTIFKEGDAMTVWVTDDDNRVPIQVFTPISVGSVKVYLKKATGLVHPLSSKVETKK